MTLPRALWIVPPAATRRHPPPPSSDCVLRWVPLARAPLCVRVVASPFDQFAKDVLDATLSSHGRVEAELEVPALSSQRADVFFDPDPAQVAALLRAGPLERMAARRCFFEPFHQAPSVPDVTACTRKLLNHQHAGELSGRPAAERSWLLCGGRPDAALGAFAMTAMPDWPRGYYGMCDALPLAVVVLSELAVTAETLPLRLMGAGSTLRGALAEMERLGPGPLRDALLRPVVQLIAAQRRRRDMSSTVLSPEEEDLMRSLPLVEELERQWLAQGVAQGVAQGQWTTLARVVERRLRRKLTPLETEALRSRLERDGDRVLDDVVDLDTQALAAWLARNPG